jgi:hypothetical protein
MDPEGDLRPLPEQLHGRPRAGTGHHQTARAGDPRFDRVDHCGIDRVIHAKVVAVDDEYPGIAREAQQLT